MQSGGRITFVSQSLNLFDRKLGLSPTELFAILELENPSNFMQFRSVDQLILRSLKLGNIRSGGPD